MNLSFAGCIIFLLSYDLWALRLPIGFGKTHFIVGTQPSAFLPTRTASTRVKKTIQPSCNRSFFAPDNNLEKLLCSYIDAEKEAIDIAIYSFTHKKIAQALVSACKKGVKIRIVTDSSGVPDRRSKITYLHQQNIPIYVYEKPLVVQALNNIMHHKFALFKNNNNDSLLWTGSFNFTHSAVINNQENVIVSNDNNLIKDYTDQFNRLLERCKRLS